MAKSDKSLLSKAKSARTNRHPMRYSDEEIELVLAWVNDEITMMQAVSAIGKEGNQAYSFFALALKQHIKDDILPSKKRN